MATSSPERAFLTVREVATRLGVGEKKIRRLIARGELPAVQLGSRRTAVRIAESELDAWLYGPPNEAA
jgi:excisionase family DNA binding protein